MHFPEYTSLRTQANSSQLGVGGELRISGQNVAIGGKNSCARKRLNYLDVFVGSDAPGCELLAIFIGLPDQSRDFAMLRRRGTQNWITDVVHSRI
jgi:hypothetical protein